MSEDGWPVAVDDCESMTPTGPFIEQLFKPALALYKREWPHILAARLYQIEGDQRRSYSAFCSSSTPKSQ